MIQQTLIITKNEKPNSNYYYKLFNDKNKIVEEKYLTTSKNPFPYKQDSIIHTNKYQYNKENKIGEISKINNHKNSIGKIVALRYKN